MCSISAYGQTGPYSTRPGFGPLVEALGGVTELTGDPNSTPVQTRYMIADNIAADKAVGAICASLFDRTRTGKGQCIDISLLDCIVEGDEATLQHYLWSKGEKKLTRRGKTDDTVVPFGIFQISDRHIAIHCATDENWGKLCNAINRMDWLTDERFSNLENRRINRKDIYGFLNEWFSKKNDAIKTVKYLQQNGVPCELAQRVDEVAEDPQINSRNMFVEKEIPGLGTKKIVNVAYKINPSNAFLSGVPPSLGEHTELILSELGYSTEEIKKLYSDKVVYSN
jgi:formyl-CoA transferase/CoA:oxalate CoA-transferase